MSLSLSHLVNVFIFLVQENVFVCALHISIDKVKEILF